MDSLSLFLIMGIVILLFASGMIVYDTWMADSGQYYLVEYVKEL